jgi:hypothetical protein
MKLGWVSLAAAMAGVGAMGCGGPFASGVRAYEHGRYSEAVEELREAEPDAATLGDRARARYALYRGLAHLALGDHAATRRWLGEARTAVLAAPTLLGDDDLGRLSAAWAHLPAE